MSAVPGPARSKCAEAPPGASSSERKILSGKDAVVVFFYLCPWIKSQRAVRAVRHSQAGRGETGLPSNMVHGDHGVPAPATMKDLLYPAHHELLVYS